MSSDLGRRPVQRVHRHIYLVMRNDLPSGVTVQRCPPWTQEDAEKLDEEARYRATAKLSVYSADAALNSDQVAECRRLRRRDPERWGVRQLAKRYGCGVASIIRVLDYGTVAPARPPSREEWGLK